MIEADERRLNIEEWKKINEDEEFFKGFLSGNEEAFVKLTIIQQRFIFGYSLKDIRGWNRDHCYEYASNNFSMSYITCRASAQRLMHHPKVKPFLEKIDWARVESMGFTAQRILEEEQALAYSDITDYLEPDEQGNFPIVNLKTLPGPIRRAIRSVEVVYSPTGERRYKIKVWDKGASLSRLQKCKGMHQENIKLESKNLNVDIDEDTDPVKASQLYAQLLRGNLE